MICNTCKKTATKKLKCSGCGRTGCEHCMGPDALLAAGKCKFCVAEMPQYKKIMGAR